jgi:hypothetical protein
MIDIGRMPAGTEPTMSGKTVETTPAAPGLNAVVRIQDIKKNVKPALPRDVQTMLAHRFQVPILVKVLIVELIIAKHG